MTQDQSARTILAAKLKEYRIQAGLTIFEVGDKIGKSGKTVSAWENGHGQPDAEMFVKLYNLYNMKSMSEFSSYFLGRIVSLVYEPKIKLSSISPLVK